MTYTADPEPLVFNASMETENASIEEQYFDNIFRHTDAALNKTPGGNEILKLTAANNVGSNIILSVMPGDEIDLDVWCAYQAGSDYNTTYGLAAMINAVAGAFGGAAGAGGEAEAIYDAINEGLPLIDYAPRSAISKSILNYGKTFMPQDQSQKKPKWKFF